MVGTVKKAGADEVALGRSVIESKNILKSYFRKHFKIIFPAPFWTIARHRKSFQMEKIHFWPSNYCPSLVLAIEL